MPRIALIANPSAGRGQGGRIAGEALKPLRSADPHCEAVQSRGPGQIASLVASALRTNVNLVAVAGGDGTVNEAVNGYVGIAGEHQALGVIPVGTGNDFAKMLGVGNNWQLACERIVAGQLRRVDLGRCNGRVFANGIGAGFDALVALEANGIGWLRGNAVYGVAVARTLLLRYATPNARIVHDGGVLESRITMLAAANGTTYGGAFRIAPWRAAKTVAAHSGGATPDSHRLPVTRTQGNGESRLPPGRKPPRAKRSSRTGSAPSVVTMSV